MLKERVITAVVLLIAILAAYMASPIAFIGLMGVGFTLALWEWLRLAGIQSKASMLVAGVVGITMMSVTYLIHLDLVGGSKENWAFYYDLMAYFVLYLAVVTLLWLGISVRVFLARHKGFKVNHTVVALTGIFFVPAAWLAFVATYSSWGIMMVLSVLCLVWIADIMAYFAGRAFGKRRLAPALSPKKSWEGVAGGMISVIVIGYAAAWGIEAETMPSLMINTTGVAGWGIAAVILVALSIVGDLWESTLKRQAGIKDSSNLLPGHGGFYDRLDAMMPTLPAAFVLLLLCSFVPAL